MVLLRKTVFLSSGIIWKWKFIEFSIYCFVKLRHFVIFVAYKQQVSKKPQRAIFTYFLICNCNSTNEVSFCYKDIKIFDLDLSPLLLLKNDSLLDFIFPLIFPSSHQIFVSAFFSLDLYFALVLLNISEHQNY